MSIVNVDGLKIREGPSLNSGVVGHYNCGDVIRSGDLLIQNEGRTWLRYYGATTGVPRFVCAKDNNGSIFINVDSNIRGGNPIPSPVSQCTRGGETGFSGIPLQKKFPIEGIKLYGCAFLCACVKGGLTNQDQCLQCYHWAKDTGKIRGSDCYVNIGTEKLASEIPGRFGTPFHGDFCIQRSGRPHFWLTQNGQEIFNSAGIGYH